MQIRDPLAANAVNEHQHRYGTHYRKIHDILASCALGRIHAVCATAAGWMMHTLSHLIDYIRRYNSNTEAEWVMTQADGRGKLAEVHPSPDHVAGTIHFANGVRGVIEDARGHA